MCDVYVQLVKFNFLNTSLFTYPILNDYTEGREGFKVLLDLLQIRQYYCDFITSQLYLIGSPNTPPVALSPRVLYGNFLVLLPPI